MIIILPEFLLSLGVLILIVYELKLPNLDSELYPNPNILKISIVGVFLIIFINFWWWAGFLCEVNNLIYWTNGLLLINSWVNISKIVIVVGCISLLLMYNVPGRLIVKSKSKDFDFTPSPTTLPSRLRREFTPNQTSPIHLKGNRGNSPPKGGGEILIWNLEPLRAPNLPLTSSDPNLNLGGSNSPPLPPSAGGGKLGELNRGSGEFSVLMLIILLSGLLLVSSVNWLSIYLALELQTLTLFIVVAIKKESAYSTEAGLKYFVLGAMSSGLFLFGCALLYGFSGETSIQGINSILTGDVGIILITVSLLFKLSAAPFHMWAPDVYEGAPTISTALLAIVPKIGVFSILVQVGLVSNIVLFCGALSIVYGAIGALNQTKMKRLLAYSGIGHMGFILFGVAIGSFESIQASLIYIIIYVIMSICGFSILLSLKLSRALIIEVSSLSRENPVIALTLSLTFLSTAGVPPLAGFLSKWMVLLSGVSSEYYLLCIMIVVSSVIAGVYYVRVVQIIYFPPIGDLPSDSPDREGGRGFLDSSPLTSPDPNFNLGRGLPRLSWGGSWGKAVNKLPIINLKKSILIGAVFFIILFLMTSPNWLLQITHEATISLYI